MLTTDTTAKITNDDIPALANIGHSKLEHRHKARYQVAGGADVAAVNQIIHRAYKAGTVLAAYATPDAVPAGGTLSITIDIHKSTGGGAWATILSSTTTISSAGTARTPIAMSLSGTPALIAGDLLKVIITVAGAAGTNVQGLLVDVDIAENCA
jgi:hypothetical protein